MAPSISPFMINCQTVPSPKVIPRPTSSVTLILFVAIALRPVAGAGDMLGPETALRHSFAASMG